MRIMHIITRMILGGAQENTLLSVRGQMVLKDTTVCLVTGPTIGPEGSLVGEAREHQVELIEVPTLTRAISPLKELQAYRALRQTIRDWRPDVVHTHSAKAGVLGRYAAAKEKVPLIVHTIHGLPFHPYQSSLVNAVYRFAEKSAAARCQRLISVADAMTEKAVAAGIARPDKFQTIYSGMEMEPFLTDGGERVRIRSMLGIGPESTLIGKIARLFDLKGHVYLIDAFAALSRDHPLLRLLLVGDGTLKSDLEAQAERLNVADKISFAGLIPHDEVPGWIQAMDIVAHCSLREGLARVLPQALLCGKPTISFDVDGAKEVIKNGETGWLIPPADTQALINGLKEILAEPEKAKTLAGKGKALCRERFDWQVMARALMEVYARNLVG